MRDKLIKNYNNEIVNNYDIEDTKEVLKYEKQQLKDYLKDKENFYKKIRHNREKNNP